MKRLRALGGGVVSVVLIGSYSQSLRWAALRCAVHAFTASLTESP